MVSFITKLWIATSQDMSYHPSDLYTIHVISLLCKSINAEFFFRENSQYSEFIRNIKIIMVDFCHFTKFFTCFQSQIETSHIAYFGTNIYKGVFLPNIITNMTWVHYGDDEFDLDQDSQYIEDSEVRVRDVCGSASLTPCGINERPDGSNCIKINN